ncbi:hypothetical protein MNEG_4329 [Monoraphidium neglectum]|uniref:Uncharacterized protein n=1 Tax=Monoraphidium neglectum TaxID=145388 RepID=A0A0D2LA31_9CHLO|nr:hypothetical protein MNEG_4329 [Monoraphidium neglectum]KIZ03629.1 hypothetical protein MNEG_4329 [Monoraphidium neglectum]|eukprot:XP_013902648.1 hypothetical protein MNEG_4329 [Monoraphidium neglectum]
MVSFLTTLVTYPFVYLLLARAARGEGALGGFMLDGRRRLEDFPEGRAIVDLERWCRTNAYLSVTEELVHKYARTAAAIVDVYVANST